MSDPTQIELPNVPITHVSGIRYVPPGHVLVAHLRDRETGRAAIYTDDQWPAHCNAGNAIYQWLEGNYSCDCNRSIFMRGASPELECSHGENRIVLDKLFWDGEELDISE